MAHIEREIKLRLTPQSLPKLARLAPRRRNVTSVYFDTARQDLRRAGIALRLRRDGSQWLQTVKAESAQHAGLAARSEWELPVRGKALEPEAFPGDEIRSVTGIDLARLAHRLRPVFETRFSRRSGVVQVDGKVSAELSIDRGAIIAGKRRETISEVELELISGETAALLSFAEALALPLAYESKAERGYRLAAGLPPGPRKSRMPAVAPSGPPGDAFDAVFSAALMQAGTNVAGMLASRDPEYLHQLRVGLRRLRSAMGAFSPVVEDAKPLKRALRRLMPSLGAARDWDVFVQVLQDAGAGAGVLQRARRERAIARRAAQETVASPEFRAFLFQSLRWLQSNPTRDGGALQDFAPGRLERLYRKTVRDYEPRNAKRRHRFRIRIKRLRYASHFFAGCFPADGVQPHLRELARLQDILGELNDLATARKLLREIEAPRPGELAQREAKLIAALEAAWKRFASLPPYWRPPG
jgi:triphosphatase